MGFERSTLDAEEIWLEMMRLGLLPRNLSWRAFLWYSEEAKVVYLCCWEVDVLFRSFICRMGRRIAFYEGGGLRGGL